MQTTFILGSSSPRRRELFSALGLPFTVYKPDIDESVKHGETPTVYVQRMAAQKAFAGGVGRMLAGQLDGSAGDYVVIAADTIVVSPDGAYILGKPADTDEAAATLRLLRGQTHTVCTAVYVERFSRRMSGSIQTGDAHEWVQTHVTMRDYSDDEITAYIASGDPFDKAGGYAIQHAGFRPVAHIDGCYTNVVGLPMCAVKRCLAELGLIPEDDAPAPDVCDCGSAR